jgi:hypothetical protein
VTGAAPKPPAPAPIEFAPLEAVPTEEAYPEAVADEPGALSDGEQRCLEKELHRGERVVWAGKPDAGLAFRKGLQVMGVLIVAFLFGVGMIYLAHRMMTDKDKEVPEMGWWFMGILAGLSVAALVSGIFYPFHLRWRYRRNFYVITDRRAIVFAANFIGWLRPETYMPADLQYVRRKDIGKDGAADLVFKTKTVTYGVSGGSGPPELKRNAVGQRVIERKKQEGGQQSVDVDYGFLKLRDADRVQQILTETLVAPWAAEFGKKRPQPAEQ